MQKTPRAPKAPKPSPRVPAEPEAATAPGAQGASPTELLLHASRLVGDLTVRRMRAQFPGFRASLGRLLPLLDAGTARLTDLSQRLGVSKQAAGQLVEELESEGLLQREADPADRRARRVRLTARGKRIVADVRELHASFDAALSARLGAGDRATVVAAMLELSRWAEGAGAALEPSVE
jgi:DNA-binding MarR family transcriptional regulator